MGVPFNARDPERIFHCADEFFPDAFLNRIPSSRENAGEAEARIIQTFPRYRSSQGHKQLVNAGWGSKLACFTTAHSIQQTIERDEQTPAIVEGFKRLA